MDIYHIYGYIPYIDMDMYMQYIDIYICTV